MFTYPITRETLINNTFAILNMVSVIIFYGSSGSPGDYEVDNGDFWCAERSTDC